MDQEARVKAAIEQGGIDRVIVIDDAFDPPTIGDEEAGPLLDLLTRDEHERTRRRAGLDPAETEAAAQALNETEYAHDAVTAVVAKLYARFVDRFDRRFDPAGRFEALKGSNLSYVRPLLKLLGKCAGVTVVRVGSRDRQAELANDQAQVVFVDYYLDETFTPASDPDGAQGAEARGASLRMLRAVLDAQPGAGPSVMLMSSHAVRARADAFRKEVRDSKRAIFASRFGYMAKDDLKEDERGAIEIASAAADALLDVAQRHMFAGAVEDALTHWKAGADRAIETLWSRITDLELKDFAYLSRFRLTDEGQPLSTYLEWFFGEVLVDTVARSVDWGQQSWRTLDDGAAKGRPGGQIEGAFDGPTTGVADLYYRARVDARPGRQGEDMRVGDLYVGPAPDEVLAVITPECDLVKRRKGRSAPRITAVAGRLNPLSGPDTSVADFLIHEGELRNVVWNPKDLRTIEYEEIGADGGYRLIGTLRPLYAHELQRRTLDEFGRVALAVAPAMAVNARASVVVRGRDGPIRLDVGQAGEASCAVIPKRGGSDKPRVVYRRSFAEGILQRLSSMTEEVHESARAELAKVLAAKTQIGFLEKLCRDGQKDGETAFGALTSLSPETTGEKAPWCQILVEAHSLDGGDGGRTDDDADEPRCEETSAGESTAAAAPTRDTGVATPSRTGGQA